jgi:DNA-binding response OmpR family regulator
MREDEVIDILILLDDHLLGELIGSMLDMAGYTYRKTSSTAEALTFLRDGTVDLFIMSASLSESYNWSELYSLMKAEPELQKIGIVILYPRTDPAEDVYANGDSYLMIPFPLEELLIVSNRVLTNYGKVLPTVEERQRQFEQCREQLKRRHNWSDEKLEEYRKNLLRKAGLI